MIWLTHIICVVVGVAIGMGIGWEQGYRIGRQRPVNEAEFTDLATQPYADYCRVCDRTVEVIGPGYRL